MFGIDDLAFAVLASGALAAGSSAYGASKGLQATADTNLMNLMLQREQQSWQEKMSNTSYQRAVSDLKSAGLNPMLAYAQGGASTPNVQAAHFENPGSIYAQAGRDIGSAISGTIPQMLTKEQIATQKTQQAVNSAQAVDIAAGATRKMLENKVIAERVDREVYKEHQRRKSSGWDLFLDDMQRGIDTMNPLRGIFSK